MPRPLLRFARRACEVAAFALLSSTCLAQDEAPSTTGQTGLLSMPDGRLAPEGTWRTGMSFMRPYQAIWSSITVLPWLEPSFRYTRILYVPGGLGPSFGDFKDKSFDIKLRAFPETEQRPSLVFGLQDAQGTAIFRSYYVAASKRFGEFDVTLGYGGKRIDGAFGGVRYSPGSMPNWSVVAEYDAYDYKRDVGSARSGSARYKKEPAVGIEYRTPWWGAKAFAAHGELGLNAYVSVPLEQKEFVPKFEEPPPYTKIKPRPNEAQWASDGAHRARLVRALRAQDFRDIRIAYENGVLSATLTNFRISSMPRAVGRAARTMLSFAPLEVRELRVTYVDGLLPLATYTFIHVPTLQRYFNGMASRQQLAQYVAIDYAKPGARSEQADRNEALAAFEEPLPERLVLGREGPHAIALSGEILGGRLLVRPGLSTYFNDPAGALKADLSAVALYDRPLGRGLVLNTEVKLTLWENVSDVTQPSNSLLPRVRTDVAEYKRGGDLKLLRLLANKYSHPSERVYTRLSAGIYEEMYSGFGGQVLYLPRDGRWALDVAADWVKQRDFRGFLGHRDYSTLTAIASLNYRMAQGVTATARAGRFLAKDEGVRFEMKRRFASGFEVGAWYTFTNGNDITSPGSPSNPYRDKGIFMAMPLDPLLTQDTRASAGFALSPWTRDVGQMVASPGDLYRMTERSVLQLHEHDGMVRLGDREDDYDLPNLGTGVRERRWPEFVGEDLFAMRRAAGKVDWVGTAILGTAITLASASLDKRAFEKADRHRDSRWVKDGVKFGDALPLLALGASGLAAFDESRPRLSDAGVAALEAGAGALLLSEGIKYAVGRARPTAGLGRAEFEPGSSEDRFKSFPSRHTTLMWAAVTPYAREFGANWLYGVAALTNLARVGSREHWVSDTVAGSVIGYTLGSLAWEARREARTRKGSAQVLVGPQSVGMLWVTE